MKRSICLIAESLDRRRGGAEAYLADLTQALAEAGHAVRAYVCRSGEEATAAEVEVVPSCGSGALREWHFARAIRRRLSGAGGIVFSTLPMRLPEITHYLSVAGLYRVAFEAERASFEPGLRQRLFRFGNRLNLGRQWLMAMQERLLHREPPPQILTFSAALRNQMLERFQVPARDVTRLPLGVNLSRFQPGKGTPQRWGVNPAPQHLVLVFVAHNFRLKGLHCLLSALAAASRRGLKADLLVAGDGPRAAFERLARQLGVAAQVRFLGRVADAEMGELYRAGDALLHPTFADHCSLVVLEALASGLPVITTRCNGAAEIIESGREGFVVENPRDIEALAQALLRIHDRRTLVAMSAAAVALRPRLDFAEHARRVADWLTATGAEPC